MRLKAWGLIFFLSLLWHILESHLQNIVIIFQKKIKKLLVFQKLDSFFEALRLEAWGLRLEFFFFQFFGLYLNLIFKTSYFFFQKKIKKLLVFQKLDSFFEALRLEAFITRVQWARSCSSTTNHNLPTNQYSRSVRLVQHHWLVLVVGHCKSNRWCAIAL